MSDRDALAALIRPHLDGDTLPDHLVGGMAAGWHAEQIADAVLTAGEWTPNKACGHPDRYDLRGEDDECIACAIEDGTPKTE